MIQSQTLNDLMIEKVAYGIADLKSDAKGIYRYAKNGFLGIPLSITKEGLDDTVQTVTNKMNIDLPERTPFIRTYTDTELDFKNRRAIKNMDSIARKHGYTYSGDNTWYNNKTQKTFKLDDVVAGTSPTSFQGPHMMGREAKPRIQKIDAITKKIFTPVLDKSGLSWDDFEDFTLEKRFKPGDIDTIRVGKSGRLRTKGVLAHEFGHHLQGPKMRKLDTLARFTASQAPNLAAINTVVGPFTYGIPATMAINKGLAATTAVAGATVAGSELQASYLGSKHLGNNIRHRSRAFAGVPSYMAGIITGPKTTLQNNVKVLKKLVKLK